MCAVPTDLFQVQIRSQIGNAVTSHSTIRYLICNRFSVENKIGMDVNEYEKTTTDLFNES